MLSVLDFVARLEGGKLTPRAAVELCAEAIAAREDDIAAFTAHQMGSCRMGCDPAESVANGRGELHDTGGVWIGDASAFPTAPGVNPMISIMSLAHQTAANILAAG